jgi:hypothetical protein
MFRYFQKKMSSQDFPEQRENRWPEISQVFVTHLTFELLAAVSTGTQFDRFEWINPSHALLISAVCSERSSFLRATREVVRRNADLRKVCRPRLCGKC